MDTGTSNPILTSFQGPMPTPAPSGFASWTGLRPTVVKGTIIGCDSDMPPTIFTPILCGVPSQVTLSCEVATPASVNTPDYCSTSANVTNFTPYIGDEIGSVVRAGAMILSTAGQNSTALDTATAISMRSTDAGILPYATPVPGGQ
jgi:hypothetical protein